MRLAILVLFSLLTTVGCGVRVHYTYRGYAYGYGHYYGYSTSYGHTGIVWNQPAPPPPPPGVIAAPPPQATGEFEVNGSDGSYGWEKTCNADVEQHRLSEQMAKKGCTFDSYGYDETRAVCPGGSSKAGGQPALEQGVHVLLRRDATHVYRLCPAGTDRQVCMNAWAPVLAP